MSLKYNQLLRYNKKYLFWLAYIVYLAELLLFASVFGEFSTLKLGFALARNISYGLICLKILIDIFYGEYSKKEILVNIIGTLFLLILAKMTGNKSMLIYWIFIVASHDIELKKVVKAAISVHLLCMIVIIGSSAFGLIKDRIYMEAADRARASLGYQYTTDSSNYFFYIILMYVYLKGEKISWESIGVLGICNILLFKLTDTKSPFILGISILGLAAILKIFVILRKNNIIYKLCVTLSIPTVAGIMICLSIFFNNQVNWMVKLNSILNGRLELGYNAYKAYGLHWLGQNIQWVGINSDFTDTPQIYNYVDSSYVQILLNYGLIFFGGVCILFILLAIKVGEKNDIYLMFVLVVIALHSVLDPQLLWMAYNPFVMCFSYFHKDDT
jgi:hypothetical protein